MSRTPDDEKYRRILERAYEEFNRKGFRNATIKSIADQAEVAPGSVYTYFDNKADLFLQTVQHLWQRIYQEVDRSLQSNEPFRPRFFRLFDQVQTLLCSSPVFLSGMISSEARRRTLRENINQLARKVLPLFREPEARPIGVWNSSEDADMQLLSLTLTGALFQGALAGPEKIKDVFSKLRLLLEKRLDGTP